MARPRSGTKVYIPTRIGIAELGLAGYVGDGLPLTFLGFHFQFYYPSAYTVQGLIGWEQKSETPSALTDIVVIVPK